jgi:glycosyltransferase involved in cell wall biosynthesis
MTGRRRYRSLRIALIGEGAYPVGPGGVSLWCHQLIEGMPEHTFIAVALTVDGTERGTWPVPDNLTRIISIPLWGRKGRTRPRLRPPSSTFTDAHEAFLRALLRPHGDGSEPEEAAGEFDDALRAMVDNARDGDVSGELASDDAVRRLLEAWRWTGPSRAGTRVRDRLSLREALMASSRIEHMLRPLSLPALDVDVCHLSMGGPSVLVAMKSAWTFGTPMVLSEHGVYLRERYLALVSDEAPYPVRVLAMRFQRALMSAAYRRAEVLAPHASFNRRWQEHGGGTDDRIQTMYNGIDPADFPAAQEEPDEPTIVFVGRVDPLKDLHTLIRAFAIVRAAVPGARLRMFGPVTKDNEEYHRSCLALIDELGLVGSATFEGRVGRTVDAYRAGHLVALTSVSEGFPFTIVEAMSVGRPQVATDVGGVSEAVGDAGFVVPPRDHEAVAEACVTLLSNDALRRQMGNQARRRVLDRFTLQQWTDAYRDIYAAVAPAPRHTYVARSLPDIPRVREAAGPTTLRVPGRVAAAEVAL